MKPQTRQGAGNDGGIRMAPGGREEPRGKYRWWTEEDRETMRRDFRPGRNNAELAARMGRSLTAVKSQATKMGLCRPSRQPNRWTPQEDDRLRDMVGRLNDERCALALGRGVNSVRIRAKRLGLSWQDHDGWYNATEVARILGVDRHWVLLRIKQGTLRASPFGNREPQQRGMACWRIGEQDLRGFLRRYPHELSGRNVDLVQIVQILAGLDYGGGG